MPTVAETRKGTATRKFPTQIETSIAVLKAGKMSKPSRRTPYTELLEAFDQLPKGAEYEVEMKTEAKPSSVVLGLRRTISRDERHRFDDIQVHQVGDEVWLKK